MKCPGVLSPPILTPCPVGGFIHRLIPRCRLEEGEEAALLLPINPLPFSPGCHSLFPCPPWLTRRPHVRGPAWAEPPGAAQPSGRTPPSPLSPGKGGPGARSAPRPAEP